MKPSELTVALETLILAERPGFAWGAPGIGKSQVMQQTAKHLKIQLIDRRAVLMDPTDLSGLPRFNPSGQATWAVPDWLPTKGKGVLFLDELNRAPQLVQNACLQLALDRRLNDYVLPKGWVVMAAGNRESDGGGVTRLNAALASRFVHLDVEVDLDDWCKWAVSANIDPMVIAFVRFRPELLHKFDPKERAFPNPRSWEFVSTIVAQAPPAHVEHALFSGAIGAPAAGEFSAFVRLYRSLPSIDAILLDPAKAAVPTQPATLFAVASALARRASEKTIGRVITYLERLPVEFNVMAIKDAVTRDSEVASCPEFTKWCVAHSDVTFG
jgi:MoxR-like ATPase